MTRPIAALFALLLLAACSGDMGMGGETPASDPLGSNSPDPAMMNDDTAGSVIPSN